MIPFLFFAVIIDFVIGDPRLHPVAWIGTLAARMELFFRKTIANERFAGIVTVLLVLVVTGGAVLLFLFPFLRPGSEFSWILPGVSSLLLSFSFAIRSLLNHTRDVRRALDANDLEQARSNVAKIVGRRTQHLAKSEVIRAAVEATAESLTDSITAPLFYASIGWLIGGDAYGVVAGTVFAFLYRAINTMDSMFGHRSPEWLRFGWFAARLDDAANFIPARIGIPFVALAAFLLSERGKGAIAIWLRDRNNHASPNAGQSEAAFAGALGLRLGGTNRYGETDEVRPYIGDPIESFENGHIDRANRLLFLTTALFIVFLAVVSMIPVS